MFTWPWLCKSVYGLTIVLLSVYSSSSLLFCISTHKHDRQVSLSVLSGLSSVDWGLGCFRPTFLFQLSSCPVQNLPDITVMVDWALTINYLSRSKCATFSTFTVNWFKPLRFHVHRFKERKHIFDSSCFISPPFHTCEGPVVGCRERRN